MADEVERMARLMQRMTEAMQEAAVLCQHRSRLLCTDCAARAAMQTQSREESSGPPPPPE